MADVPPPPPSGPSGAGLPPGARPPTVTAAGVILVVVGGLSILLTLLALPALQEAVRLAGDAVPGWFYPLLILGVILAALEIVAGVLILRGRPVGRTMGITVASISVALLLLNLVGGGSQMVFALIAIVLRVLVIIWLTQNRAAFQSA